MSTTRIMKLEDTIQRGFERIDTKQDIIRKELTDHRIEQAGKVTEITGKADAAHLRMDNHKREHERARAWWLALWLTAIGAVLAHIFRWITGQNK
jgi:hypothetical protein